MNIHRYHNKYVFNEYLSRFNSYYYKLSIKKKIYYVILCSNFVCTGKCYLKKDSSIKKLPNRIAKKVEYLYLHNCLLLENINLNYTNLIVMKLDCLAIEKLPQELVNLKSLELTRCINLRKLPSTYVNLEFLYVNHCPINEIPETFTKLKHLYLEETCVVIINDKFVNLEYLYIKRFYNERSNLLSRLPDSLVNLKSLYLEGTCINYLPKTLVNLEYLEIDANFVYEHKNIPDTFINLKAVVLKWNYIRNMPNIQNLEYFYFEHCSFINRLQYLPKVRVETSYPISYNEKKKIYDIKKIIYICIIRKFRYFDFKCLYIDKFIF